MPSIVLIAACIGLVFPSPATAAGDCIEATPPAPSGPTLDPGLAGAEQNSNIPAPAPASAGAVHASFGTPGSWYWSLGAGVGVIPQSTDVSGNITFGTFLAERFEFNCGLTGWGFLQEGEDALGVNPAFAFRYHMILRERWSLYAEAGIGLLLATDDVPSNGTSFDFTPRAGVGATIALGGSAARLDVGVRWQHVSNARITGSDDNPSRDSPMVYAGVIFPF